MKLNYMIAALGLVASVGAHAAIGGPGGTAADPTAAPELFAVVYDENSSFTIDLGITFASFLAGGNASSATWATLNSSDSIWNSFISTADTANLQYAVIGSGKTTTTGLPFPTLSTVQVGEEGSVSDGTYDNGNVTTASAQTQAYANAVNVTGTHKTQANGESVNLKGSGAYFEDYQTSSFNGVLFDNNNAVNTASEFTLVYRSPGGVSPTLAEKVQAGTVLLTGSGSSYTLTYTTAVAAVPEPTGYALALAGFGAFGFIARRRRNS